MSEAAKILTNPSCAEWIKNLLTQLGTDPTQTNILDIIESVTFVYGDTVKGEYAFSGATIHGSLANNDAQIEFSTPYAFVSIGPVNKTVEAAFYRQRNRLHGQSAIHESFHLAGYGDMAAAQAVARMRNMDQNQFNRELARYAGVNPADLDKLTPKQRIAAASHWWGGRSLLLRA